MKRGISGVVLVIAALASSGLPAYGADSEKVEKKANKIMKQVFGPCFTPIYSGKLKKASVVSTSREVQGVVPVQVFLISVGSGKETDYEFRVNTGLGKYKGIPAPGTGIPTNPAAVALVAACFPTKPGLGTPPPSNGESRGG